MIENIIGVYMGNTIQEGVETQYGVKDKFLIDLHTDTHGDILVSGFGDLPSVLRGLETGKHLVTVTVKVVEGDNTTFYNLQYTGKGKDRVPLVNLLEDKAPPMKQPDKPTKQAELGDKAPAPNNTPSDKQIAEKDVFVLSMNARVQASNIIARCSSQAQVDLIHRNADHLAVFLLSGVWPKKEKGGKEKK